MLKFTAIEEELVVLKQILNEAKNSLNECKEMQEQINRDLAQVEFRLKSLEDELDRAKRMWSTCKM